MLSGDGASRTMLAWVTLRLPGIYVAVALLVCTTLCVLTPPFGVPDESGHARRAIEIGYGEVLAKKTAGGVGGPVDVNFLGVAVAMDAARPRLGLRHPALGAAVLAGAGMFAGTVLYAPWSAAHVFYRMGLMGAFSLVLGR